MASVPAEDDDRAGSSRRRGLSASGSRRSWASGSFREAWSMQSPDVFSRKREDEVDEDEDELRSAAIERLPTFEQLRKGVVTHVLDDGKVVVSKLGLNDMRQLMESVLKVEEDNERFLRRVRDRTDRVGIERPKIEIRY